MLDQNSVQTRKKRQIFWVKNSRLKYSNVLLCIGGAAARLTQLSATQTNTPLLTPDDSVSSSPTCMPTLKLTCDVDDLVTGVYFGVNDIDLIKCLC